MSDGKLFASGLMLLAVGCSASHDNAGTNVAPDAAGIAACEAAGGACVLGGSVCNHTGPQDCNPDENPGGAFCCLDAVCADAAKDPMIHASDYDQSCKKDADCIGVGEGDACFDCAIICGTAAINRADKARYDAAVKKTPAGQSVDEVLCHCPALSNPCCRAGVCHADSQCGSP